MSAAQGLSERLGTAAKGGYCNCPGLLLQIKAGHAPRGLECREIEPNCFALWEETPRYFSLYLVGRFSQPLRLEKRQKPYLCSHWKGDLPHIEGARFFRRFTRMDLPLRGAPQSTGARPARAEELPAIRRLLEDNLPALDVADDGALQAAVSAGLCLTIEREGQTAVAALLTLEGGRCTISNVAVDPRFRRQGLGRAIVAACLAKGAEAGARTAALWVDRENLGALRLYESMGFTPRQTAEQWIVS